MRKELPSSRWLQRFDVAFIRHGGHNGPQTLAVCRELYALPLYREGATPAAAGLAAATAYKLYRRAADLQEQVDGLLTDARANRLPTKLNPEVQA